jgi:hypothetical protein
LGTGTDRKTLAAATVRLRALAAPLRRDRAVGALACECARLAFHPGPRAAGEGARR